MNVNRENFWNFVSNNYSVELEVKLHNLSDGNFVNILLGGNISFFNELPDGHLSFLKKICLYLVLVLNICINDINLMLLFYSIQVLFTFYLQ